MKWFWILGVFLYVLVSGLFVQFVLLPRFMPAMDTGTGLMRGSDSYDFHQVAEKQAIAVREQGWSAWTLRPAGHSPAGIASAMYVLMGSPKPWAMLPVNAVLWAFAAWMLLLILRPLVISDDQAILCSIPFLVAPSALQFLTQIHKDPFIIAGTLIAWFALTRLIASRTTPMSWGEGVRNLAWMTAGLILLWVGRPYTMFLSLFGCVFVGMILLVADFIQKRTNLAVWVVLILSALMCFGMTRTKDAQEYSAVGKKMPSGMSSSGFVFHPSGLGPLDKPFMRMATMRVIYFKSYPEAQSKLDENATLDSSWKVIAYIPRAIQLLVMAPFPSSWIRPATSNPFANLVYAETAVRYLLYPGLVWLCWVKRRFLVFWIPWVFFVPWGLIYTIITPNLGTLVRVRFSLVMMLAALGAVGTVMLWNVWRSRNHDR